MPERDDVARVELDDPSSAHVVRAPVPTDFELDDEGAGGATDPSLVLPGQTGVLEAGAGARLLMDLFVHERTGRLLVELPFPGAAAPGGATAPARGTLFFLHGEPVHAASPEADEALVARLAERAALADAAAARDKQRRAMTSVPALLVRHRLARPVPVLEALRDAVRDFARAVIDATGGSWRFFDDVDFAEHTPLTAVNPFGLVLEARRKRLAPDALLRLGEALAGKTPAPLEGFANVAPRLRSFTGHVDLGGVVDGTVPASELYRLTRLDPLMGGLVLGTLADTGLVELLNRPREEGAPGKRQAQESPLPKLVQADASLSVLAQMPERGANEILSLYVELKPERDDDVILGVDVEAAPGAIERGYQARLAELDPRAIPAARVRPYLLGRAEELRSKVERAYRRRTANLPRRGGAAYEILEKLGEGGMAEVFRGRAADDPSFVVAIKRILPAHRADPSFARQFLDEARLARRVQHPNVVRVFTVGKAAEDLYLAMELVDGCDLGELLRRSKKLKLPVPVDVACRIVADACGGLHAAHTAHDRDGNIVPILHRDVSPQNILVSSSGDVKLTDFGIARAQNVTQTGEEERGMVKGKAAYLPPEVVDGRKATIRSDVYSMAMTLYAALSRAPFLRREIVPTLRAILCEPLPRMTSLRDDAPAELDAILLRAGARDPQERHGSAQELQLELEELLASRPAVDVRAWAHGLAAERHAQASPPPAVTRTVPIAEDVDLDSL